MRVRIDTLSDLKNFIRQNNVSNEIAVKAVEKALTVWILSDLTKEELLKEVDSFTTLYKTIERPIFIFN